MLDRVQVALVLAEPLAAPKDPNTQQLAEWLRNIFGPLFLVVVGIVALFFLFTREITRFVQFLVLSIAIAVIFYYPGIITAVASGIVRALGVEADT
jgi:fumarate reductase subunit D